MTLREKIERCYLGEKHQFVTENFDMILEASIPVIKPENNPNAEYTEYVDSIIEGNDFPDGVHPGWRADIIATVRSIADNLYLEYLNSSTKDDVENTSDQKPDKTGLDIYDLADDPLYENADYYDIHTGNTYLLAQYNRARRFGLPVDGIHVIMSDGTHCICRRME